MPSLNCPKCGASSGLSSVICISCGALIPKNILVSLGTLSVTWLAFSLFSVKLATFTLISVHLPPKGEVKINEEPPPASTPTPTPAPTPEAYVPPPEPEKPTEAADSAYFARARDNDNRHVSFVIHLLTNDYRWMLGRWDMLENQESQINFSPPMRRLMNRAVEIVCVGASSEEMPGGLSAEDGRKTEEWRAGRRAESIAMWVRAALREPVNVRKLNIGHRDPALIQGEPADTSDQRRVIIILVLKKEEGANIDEAFRNALRGDREKQPIYETLLTKYSLTQSLKFHWME